MTAEPVVSFAGTRLKELRQRAQLTAEQLADLIPSHVVSKTVITNIESGRKRDLTLTQAVLIACALEVPIISLIVDTSHPWDENTVDGLPDRFARLTNIELGRLAGSLEQAFGGLAASLAEKITTAEVAAARLSLAEAIPADEHAEVSDAWTTTPGGETAEYRWNGLTFAAAEREIERLKAELNDAVDQMNAVIDMIKLTGRSGLRHLSPAMERRIGDLQWRVRGLR